MTTVSRNLMLSVAVVTSGTVDPPPTSPQTLVFVDYSAETNGDGTSTSTPMNRVPSNAAPNTRIVPRPGVEYREPIDLFSSGVDGEPIILDLTGEHWPGEDGAAILTGEEPVGGVTASGTLNGGTVYDVDNVPVDWQSQISIFQGDEKLLASQYPAPADPRFSNNIAEWHQLLRSEMDPVAGTVTDKEFFDPLHAVEDLTIRGRLGVWTEHNGTSTYDIIAYDEVTGTVTLSDDFKAGTNNSGAVNPICVRNHPAGLTQPGQYIRSRARDALTFRPYGDVDPTGLLTYSGEREYGIYIGGDHLRVRGGTAKRMFKRTEQCLVDGRGGRRDVRVTDMTIEDCHFTGELIRFHNSEDILVADITMRDSAVFGVMAKDSTNVWTINVIATGHGSTAVTYRTCVGGGIIASNIKNPTGVHSNLISVYEGSVDLTVAFNDLVIDQNAAANNNCLTTHEVSGLHVVANTLVSATVKGYASWRHNALPDVGDGPDNIIANNVALVWGINPGYSAEAIYPPNRAMGQGSILVNNVSDGIHHPGVDVNDEDAASQLASQVWDVRRKNVHTRPTGGTSDSRLTSAQRTRLGEVYLGSSSDGAPSVLVQPDPSQPGFDVRARADAATDMTDGESWQWTPRGIPDAPILTFDWRGRYIPGTGEEVVDPLTLNWGGMYTDPR